MPVRANTRLKKEYQAQVKARLIKLQDKARYASVNKFITDKLKLVVATYHRFVNLNPVTPEIAEQYLAALEFATDDDFKLMLERVDRHGERIEPPSIVADLPAPDHSDIQQLPQPIGKLIGREADIAAVVSMLERNRLVTLVGAGGVGKTRLSVAVGQAVHTSYADGVRFVELANVKRDAVPRAKTDLDTVAGAIIQVLNIQEQPDQTVLETLVSAISSRSMVLILDNCEHLVDGCALLARSLLGRCQSLQILATSRRRLGLFDECDFTVPSLEYPVLRELHSENNNLANLMEFSAVCLFVQRATAVVANREFGLSELIDIAEVCRKLDGIPLAIEMAAARARSMPIDQINSRLADRFNLLIGERTSAPRHQTLNELIDWSYDLLSEPEKVMLQSMSVLTGGGSLEAAEKISAIQSGAVYDLLASLVDLNLVKYEERDQVARYSLLETIRIYAAKKLGESGEYEIVRNRHMAYFKELAVDAEPNLIGPLQIKWLRRMAEEYDNIRGALDWCLSKAECIVGLRFCGALKVVWQNRGLYSEGREWCERALHNGGVGDKSPEGAKVLNVLSFLAWNQADNETARAYGEQGLALAIEISCRLEQAIASIMLGTVDIAQGKYEAARKKITSAITIFYDIDNQWGVAVALNHLGSASDYEREFDSARDYHEKSLSIKRSIGDCMGIAASLNNLGIISHQQGEYEVANKYHNESLRVATELQDRRCIALSLSNLGLVACHSGDYDLAKEYFEQGLAIEREIGARRGIAGSLGNLGVLAYIQGNNASARSYFEECLPLQREIGEDGSISASLNNLGAITCAMGELDTARSYLIQSLTIKTKAHDFAGSVSTLEAFVNIASAEHNTVRSVVLLGATSALREQYAMILSLAEREAYGLEMADMRTALGDDVYEAAWARGSAMTLEQAVGYALSSAEVITP